MAIDWAGVSSVAVTILLIISTAFTIFIFTLPSTYTHFAPGQLTERDFTQDDHDEAERSGYAYFQEHKNANGVLETPVSVTVVVLGDIGRSPRMQYHALSIASRGGRVSLVGYAEADVHPDIAASRFITVVPIAPFPVVLQAKSKLLFVFTAPLKVLWQVWSLHRALGYRSPAMRWMLVQNPPSIPTLFTAQFMCFFRNSRLVIDWHNLGYSILALRLGPKHPLVRFSEWYEGLLSRNAEAHFAVSHAMCKLLGEKWGVRAQALHDRPPKHFRPLSSQDRSSFLQRLPETSQYARDISASRWRLIVSSTSWTSDEDFSLLLDALATYSASAASSGKKLPKILAIITGKGPLKEFYLSKVRQMNQENRLKHVVVLTAWLSTEDYAALLGAADLGVSLHCSSSGVDLPMKVVDMFGAGLPVAGYSAFEAWPELVAEGKNGRGFTDSAGLAAILDELFSKPARLDLLKEGALAEGGRRWDDEWLPVAGKLFRLSP